jgi:D-lyxose ketol-isomerase
MLSPEEVGDVRLRIAEYVEAKAGFALTEEERQRIVVVAFGDFFTSGAGAIDTVMHPRYGGRLIVFFPGQHFPEHWHPNVDEGLGKEETFRVLWGSVYSYGAGSPSSGADAKIPAGKEAVFTVRNEVLLNAGEQRSIGPEERHWFVAGPEGAVALEISSTVRDQFDRFTDGSMKADVL